MTELSEDLAPLVGERVHSLDAAGIVVMLEPGDDIYFAFPKTMTLLRGQELVLTPEILLASLDRKGNSIWALSEYDQRDRFNGTVRWSFGVYPDAERIHDERADRGSTKVINESQQVAEYRDKDAPHGLHIPLGLRS
jgi:hypothetical protein